jgi:site-specific recombinase XerD
VSRPAGVSHEYVSRDHEIAAFAKSARLKGKKPKTREAYQRDLEHCGSFLKNRVLGLPPSTPCEPPFDRLITATQHELEAYQNYLERDMRYASRSLRRKIATLRVFYRFLQTCGRRDDDPSTVLVAPPLPVSVVRTIRRGQISNVFDVRVEGLTEFKRVRNNAILHCLLSCGLRRSELVSLSLDDVDLERRTLRIRNSGGSYERYMSITAEACDALRAYLDKRPSAITSDALFVGRSGDRAASVAFVYKMVREYMKHAGIAGSTSPNTWRNTFASLLRENGPSKATLRSFLEHESPAVSGVYAQRRRT